MSYKNYFLKSLCAVFFLLLPVAVKPMETPTTNISKPISALKLRAKALFSGLMTATSFASSAYFCWDSSSTVALQEAKYLRGEAIYTVGSYLPDEVKKAARSELESYKVPHASTLPIFYEFNPFVQGSNVVTDGHAIVILEGSDSKTGLYKLFERLRATNDPAKRQALQNRWYEYRFVLGHESTHILEQDVQRNGMASFLIPICTQIAFSFIPTPFKSFWVQQVSKIFSANTKGIINNNALFFKLRNQERYADESVKDDVAILQGGVRYFEKLDANANEQLLRPIINSLKQIEGKLEESSWLGEKLKGFNGLPEDQQMKKLSWIKSVILVTHPSIDSRVRRLQQRIEIILEQEQAKKSTE